MQLRPKTIKAIFTRDEDGWWLVQLDFAPAACGFGSTIGKAIAQLDKKVTATIGEVFLHHSTTTVYEFKDWPPTRFTEQWVLTSRGYGRIRNCFT
jgi:predicted RNase H-like HicB family nuclease